MSDFDLFNLVLPAVFAALFFVLIELGKRLVLAAHVRQQFRDANDQVIEKIQALVRAHNEVLMLELEITELIEKVQPVERARWVIRMKELADSVPPAVLLQIRRFGLAEPPLPLAASPQEGRLPESSVTGTSKVTSIDAWTGKTKTG